mmetsp:Transcript_27987/g.80899  ORF Transcript_27987/g.80899 Transcript_27987/m.80899 type:complete len:263 (+) Transcript_27987:248-1036(+)
MRFSANDETMQRLSKVLCLELFERTSDDALIRLTKAGHTHAECLLRGVCALSVLLLRLDELFGRRIHAHVSRRQKDGPSALHGLKVRFLHLDIQQAQRVHPPTAVVLDLGIEGGGTPIVIEEGDRHRLAEAVQLQTAAAGGAHGAGIVDELHLDPKLLGPEHHVGVRRGAHRIADDEHGHVALPGGLVNLFGLALHHVPIGHDDLLAIVRLQPRLVHPKDGGVHFQEHLVARFDRLEASDGHISLISQAKADNVEDHFVLIE